MEKLEAVEIFAALAYEARLDIYRFLVRMGPDGASAGDISQSCEITASTLSHHLNQMRMVGLIVRRRQSRSLIYSANFKVMNKMIEFLTEECCDGQPELCRGSEGDRI